jgi:hypothetical protein
VLHDLPRCCTGCSCEAGCSGMCVSCLRLLWPLMAYACCPVHAYQHTLPPSVTVILLRCCARSLALHVCCVSAGDAVNEQLWVDKYKPRNTQVRPVLAFHKIWWAPVRSGVSLYIVSECNALSVWGRRCNLSQAVGACKRAYNCPGPLIVCYFCADLMPWQD